MTDVRYNEINAEEDGQRLDNYLIRILKGVPKSHIYRIIRGGEVRINKKRAQPSTRLSEGDAVRIPPVRLASEKEIHVGVKLEQRLNDCILFEDSGLIVVNKPTGIAVHGGSGLSLGMIEALRKTRTDLHYLELVHRLDKETSGCLLFAKKRSVLRDVQSLFAERDVKKTYWAILSNPWLGDKKKIVDVPLLRTLRNDGERFVIVSPDGKPSETRFKILEKYQQACWVEAEPKTGRTHQIRVHGASLGHPVAGDEKYGKSEAPLLPGAGKTRLFLHAHAIQFNLNGVKHYYEAPLDERFSQTLKLLRANIIP